MNILRWLTSLEGRETTLESFGGMLQLCETQDDVDKIRHQLSQYLSIFAPVAQYLNKAGSYSLHSWEVLDEETVVLKKLEAAASKPGGTAWMKKICHNMTTDLSQNVDSVDFWTCCRAFNPMKIYSGSTAPTASFVSKTLRIDNLNDELWNRYITESRNVTAAEAKDPVAWWRARENVFEEFASTAIYFLRFPTVVLGCDGIFSLAKYKFSSQQRRLNTDVAATVLQWAANGDFTSTFKHVRNNWGK
jgi:hypothetical protein